MAEETFDDAREELGVAELQVIKKLVITADDLARIAAANSVADLIKRIQSISTAHSQVDSNLAVARRVNALVGTRAKPRPSSLASQGTPITGPRIRNTQDLGGQLASVRGRVAPSPPPSTIATDPTIDAGEIRQATQRGMAIQPPRNVAQPGAAMATGQNVTPNYEQLIRATEPGSPTDAPTDSASDSASERTSELSKLSDPRWAPILKNTFAAYLSRDAKISPMALAKYLLRQPSLAVLGSASPAELMDSSCKIAEFCITHAMSRFSRNDQDHQYYGQISVSDSVAAAVHLSQNDSILLGVKAVPVSTLAVVFNTPLFSTALSGAGKVDLNIIRVENYIAALPQEQLLAKEVRETKETAEVRNADLKMWFESTALREKESEVQGTSPIVSYGTGNNSAQDYIKNDAVCTWVVLRWLEAILRG